MESTRRGQDTALAADAPCVTKAGNGDLHAPIRGPPMQGHGLQENGCQEALLHLLRDHDSCKVGHPALLGRALEGFDS